MRSQLADHFRQQREDSGLSLAELSRLAGYQNVTKGCNRIRRFEERGEIHANLLQKLADVLDIDDATIDAFIEQDRRDFERQWNEWADQPIRPHLIIRPLAAVYARKELPDGMQTVDEAESIAAEFAREHHKKVCLVWTRRLSVWFEEDGNIIGRTEAAPGKSNVPTMRLKGSRRSFLLQHPATGGTVLHLIDWPNRPMVTPSVSSTLRERK